MKKIIRDSRPGDLGWVISLHGEVYTDEFQFDADFELDIAKKIIALHENSDPFLKLWIAEVNSIRAGSIAVSRLTSETAFINFLLVLPAFRGQGIARILMHQVIDHSRVHGIARLRLETYSCLKEAREFYTKIGFDRVETKKCTEKYGHCFDQEFWETQL